MLAVCVDGLLLVQDHLLFEIMQGVLLLRNALDHLFIVSLALLNVEYFLLVVDIVDKAVQCPGALGQTLADIGPVLG